MPLPFKFDFKNPDYVEVFQYRVELLKRIRKDNSILPVLRAHYKNDICQFINDWGVTYDPRNVERGLPATIPFVLMPRQEEWILWLIERWQKQEPGITDKTRDCGISWLSIAVACSLCIFYPGLAIGFGSRKEEYVDKIGEPKCLFHKARMYMDKLPMEFKGSWDIDKHAPHMRINFPDSGSIISGECGDGIGRGDRKSIYFVDESAFLMRPQLTENSLSQTTNCRIDVSTHNGPGTIFNKKIRKGIISVFGFDWRQDPRKDQAWYDKQVDELDPVTVAQEIDRNPNASVEGVIIPSSWIESAIDAHKKLNITITGSREAGFDVADEGKDPLAVASGKGILIDHVEEWHGKGDDIFESTERVFRIADNKNIEQVWFDSDGLGAGVRGDARVINERRTMEGIRNINFDPFRGSGAVIFPDEMVPTIGANDSEEDYDGIQRTNKDYFDNYKAQSWWNLRLKFQLTHKAVQGQIDSYDPNDLISISSDIELLAELKSELCQPTYSFNNAGKMIVDKSPSGSESPNLADSVMIKSARKKPKPRGFFDL
ncbi:MAG: TerL protein [Psychroserpens sp.]|nr:TerL protein [Psychroserpens sp.]